MNGYVQVYTGNGKGKTTAALGLTLRAAGAGLRVFFAQFLKCGEYSEIAALRRFEDLVTVRQYGCPEFVTGAPGEEDRAAARRGRLEAREALVSGEYGVVVLDEVNVAVRLGLFSAGEVLELLDARPPEVELVLTGRDADPRIVERADLVTEMREVKHYYRQGIKARKGIEA